MGHDDAVSIGGRMGWNKLGVKSEPGESSFRKEELQLCSECTRKFKEWKKSYTGKPPQACEACGAKLKGRYGL